MNDATVRKAKIVYDFLEGLKRIAEELNDSLDTLERYIAELEEELIATVEATEEELKLEQDKVESLARQLEEGSKDE